MPRTQHTTRPPRRSKRRTREQTLLERVHLNAAGIDIGSGSHWVAVPPDRAEQPVREFRSQYGARCVGSQFLRSFSPARAATPRWAEKRMRPDGAWRYAGRAPEGRGRRTTGGQSPSRSLVRGCGDSRTGGTIGVTPFKRLLPRHIPALGCFTHDPQGAPRDATRTRSSTAARSTRARDSPKDPSERRRHRYRQREPLGGGARRSGRPAGTRIHEFHP